MTLFLSWHAAHVSVDRCGEPVAGADLLPKEARSGSAMDREGKLLTSSRYIPRLLAEMVENSCQTTEQSATSTRSQGARTQTRFVPQSVEAPGHSGCGKSPGPRRGTPSRRTWPCAPPRIRETGPPSRRRAAAVGLVGKALPRRFSMYISQFASNHLETVDF